MFLDTPLEVIERYLRGNVLAGADPLAPYALMSGAAGWIWGAANVMPHECVSLWDHVTSGRHADAIALWRRMLPANLYFWDNPHGAEYNSAVKTAANMVGRAVGPCRRPVTRAAPADPIETASVAGE